MFTLRTGRIALLAGAGALIAAAAPGFAQASQPPNRGAGGQRRVAPRNYLPQLQPIVQAIAEHFRARIIVDPAIIVPAAPREPAAAQSVEAALDSLVGGLKNVAWRRVYLTRAEAAAVPAADRLAAAVRSLGMIEQAGLIVVNPATQRATSFLKSFAVPANFDQVLDAQQFALAPVYVLYSTAADAVGAGGASIQDQLMSLQRQQMDLMMRLDPEQMTQAMSQGMQMYMNMDPQTRSQFFGNMMRAGMQMWMNMPADQRNQMMQEMMQNAQGMFGGGGPGVPGGAPRP
ncbi:MAG: hypothetical protein IT208_13330 [Chthonomonadales bacterium]|nr:hypothetical protein [Chthonomonadales bacterium]